MALPLWASALTEALISQFLERVRSPQLSREGKGGVSTVSPPQAHSALRGNGPRGPDMLREVSNLCYFKGRAAGNGTLER